jgi:hypothetical protein
MLHLHFNSLRTTQHPFVPDPWFVAELAPIFSGDQSEMTGHPNIVLDVNRQFDSACLLISIGGEEYLTGGVAWGPRDSLTLFAFIVGYFQESTGSSFPPDLTGPSRLPWLGTVGSPAFARLPRRPQARLLAWSRRLGIATISHALSTN